MTIVKQSREFTKIEMYLMTQGNNNTSVKELEDNTPLYVNGYLVFKDTDSNGAERQLLAIMCRDRQVYMSQSATFLRSLEGMFEVFGEMSELPVLKISGTTKAGRDYVDCTLNVAEME